tara:strand:+ start:1347 stop:1532 length:186 start_codon:yes stop_codon:yes gene_type:complete
MTWILFSLLLQSEEFHVHTQGPFITQAECLFALEIFLETAPKPEINYGAICIQTSFFGTDT